MKIPTYQLSHHQPNQLKADKNKPSKTKTGKTKIGITKTGKWPSLGFTLIEVLVALSIVSVALLAGLRASSTLTSGAERSKEMMLADICANNVLIDIRISSEYPGVGDSSSECMQGDFSFKVQRKVAPTPNPNFRRVDVQVLLGDKPLMLISTIVGKL